VSPELHPTTVVAPARSCAGRLSDPNLLVLETAIATGARISEILGLKWRHVNLQSGVIDIVQRNWRGDIDDPKSKTSKRPLTLGYLVDRYRVKAAADKAQPEEWVFTRKNGSGLPLWDSGVRQALMRAAAAEGCDFPGLGPHSFRRANITWRQEVGGSSIEASKIAGHSTVRMTEEYTKIQLTRRRRNSRAEFRSAWPPWARSSQGRCSKETGRSSKTCGPLYTARLGPGLGRII
jgi:integrase